MMSFSAPLLYLPHLSSSHHPLIVVFHLHHSPIPPLTFLLPSPPSFPPNLCLSPLCPVFFTFQSPLHLCLGDIIGDQMLSDGLTDWYGHRYTESETDSKPCRLGGRQTCSHKMSKERQIERVRHMDRRGSWQAWCVGRLSSRGDADETAVATRREIFETCSWYASQSDLQ